MRLLLSSNAPWAGTGYGQQCALIAKSLQALGHQVAIFAFYGLHGGVVEWEGIPVYPGGATEWGADIVDAHARHFQADAFITLQDVWTLPHDLGSRGIPWVAVTPVDMDPLPAGVAGPLKASCYQVVAYSRFGQRKFEEAGMQAAYIPHGVPTSYYYPDSTPKSELKKRLGFPEDCFLVGMVAANKGWPSRKAFEEVFAAFRPVMDEHPDVYLYLHSMSSGLHRGANLNDLAVSYGISSRVRFVSPYYLLTDYDRDSMRKTYCAMDVLLSPSYGEGFGVPIVEAQACGVPVIVTNFSSMPELCGGGWVVQPSRKIWTGLNSFQVHPDIGGIAEALREAYRLRDNSQIKAQALALGRSYNQTLVQEKYWRPMLDDLGKRLMGPAHGGIEDLRRGVAA